MKVEDSSQQTPDDAPAARPRSFNRAVAALLSLLVAGTGQMYKGETMNGLTWLVVIKMCYGIGLLMLFLAVLPVGRALLIFGIFLHIVCVFHATRDTREGTEIPART